MNDKQDPRRDFLLYDHVKEQSRRRNQSIEDSEVLFFFSSITLSLSDNSIKPFKSFAHSIRLRS